MFSKKKDQPNYYNYLSHDRFPLEVASEGLVFRFNTQFASWNLGFRFLDSKNRNHHAIDFDEAERLATLGTDLVFTNDINLRNSNRDATRVISLLSLENEHNLIAQTHSGISDSFQLSFDGRIVDPDRVEIYFYYLRSTHSLYYSYLDGKGAMLSGYVGIPQESVALRLFGSGRPLSPAFKVEILTLKQLEKKPVSLRFGNIILRQGDMFNSDPILNANLTVIPASQSGSVNLNFQQRLFEIGMPLPTPETPGTVRINRMPKTKNTFIAYAYSVNENKSLLNVISKICASIREIAVSQVNDGLSPISGVNMPLLGTGAGGLSPLDVLKVYDREFNHGTLIAPIVVSVISHDLFDEIRRIFRREIVPLMHEFQNAKPSIIAGIEQSLEIEIPFNNFELDFNGEVIFLDLQNQVLKSDIAQLSNLRGLLSLGLNNTGISNLNFLHNLTRLHSLYIRNAKVRDFDFLPYLSRLTTLDCSGIKGFPIDTLVSNTPGLRRLSMCGNTLRSVEFVKFLPNLETLELDFNQISDLSPLIDVPNLYSLNIARNLVEDVTPLRFTKRLRHLDISGNRVRMFNIGALIDKLVYLKADQNPFVPEAQLILNDGENHQTMIKNYLLRQAENNKQKVRLPAKVLLMGNHASGKSSLLNYIQEGKLPKSMSSTHIIQIQRYPLTGGQLPLAMFYDFGGQDYYHGIYRAFLSGGAINLILWNASNNLNQIREDSHKRITQDFKLDYWLAQKQYLENEKESGVVAPVMLIQTRSDEHQKISHEISATEHGIENEFFVCLSSEAKFPNPHRKEIQKRALKYLKSSILAMIHDNQVEKEEPIWYIDFLQYVISQATIGDHHPRKVKDLLKYYRRNVPNKINYLKDDLHQLFRQGLILYYKDDLPDEVWLNPVALVKYVHSDILNSKLIADSKGSVPPSVFTADQMEIVKLLVKQKVLFLHEITGEYIIPNFLCLAKKHGELELYTFGLGDPLFTMKFKKFLPFGLINQIICFFGELPDEKRFWRDRLLFTLDGKAKVLININFQLLEIDVFIAFASEVEQVEKEQIKKYLFYGILGLYWDLDLLKFKDFTAYVDGSLKMDAFSEEDPMHLKLMATDSFYNNPACRPMDLFISLNHKDFINYKDLCSDEGSVAIIAYGRSSSGEFDGTSSSIPIYQFQAFTPNILNRRKNVAISYSKKDLILVNKFKDYLRPLYDDELINHPWYCTELIAGTEWDLEIQKKFEAADIIFFMISENLMATKYVLDNEIKNAIDKYDSTGKLMIVPIVLVPYRFQRNGKYNLGRFSAMPYTLMPVTSFGNQNDAWYVISESIRIMIEKDLNPARSDELTTELRKHFEKIIRESSGQILYANRTEEVAGPSEEELPKPGEPNLKKEEE